jgi:hypothetical protein
LQEGKAIVLSSLHHVERILQCQTKRTAVC